MWLLIHTHDIVGMWVRRLYHQGIGELNSLWKIKLYYLKKKIGRSHDIAGTIVLRLFWCKKLVKIIFWYLSMKAISFRLEI